MLFGGIAGPVAIGAAVLANRVGLLAALGSILLVSGLALLLAVLLGTMLAAPISASPLARAALLPWAVVLQVTPVVAIAPLVIVWIGDPFASLVVCATVVAFVPVFSNTASGLAYRILESGYRLQIPRMFAALSLLALAGIARSPQPLAGWSGWSTAGVEPDGARWHKQGHGEPTTDVEGPARL